MQMHNNIVPLCDSLIELRFILKMLFMFYLGKTAV